MSEQNNQFATDVKEGLTSRPKRLSSKYFYDEEGDRLFQKIMKMDEYYLTNSEYEIFSMQKEQIMQAFQEKNEPFQLIELGAGDGYKTKVLIEYLIANKVDFEYIPIDISPHILKVLETNLKKSFPELKIKPIAETYTNAFKLLEKEDSGKRKIMLFLGSTIGNFPAPIAKEFLIGLSEHLAINDKLFIGFDLKKNPHTILAAYNDKEGITKAFNLNLLKRINRELSADFDLMKFDHYTTYDPLSGEVRSYLISLAKQSVFVQNIDQTINFELNEPIHVEISKKYSLDEIEEIATDAGFQLSKNFFDCKHFYVDSLWVKK